MFHLGLEQNGVATRNRKICVLLKIVKPLMYITSVAERSKAADLDSVLCERGMGSNPIRGTIIF